MVGKGRLKLRIFGNGSGELIFYERAKHPSPRASTYLVYPTGHPKPLQAILMASLGVRGIVRKERLLYMVGSTRVHLDKVEGLGSFVEIEAVLGPEESAEPGLVRVNFLMEKLGIVQGDLIGVAYIDLLEATGENQK